MSCSKDYTTISPNNNKTKKEGGDDEVEEKEEWEVQRDGCKERGDGLFRKGLWKEAIQQYSEALALDPTNHILLSNRSASYLSNNEKSRALDDANACIKHCPSTFQAKAYSRLGAALLSLGRYQPALDTYQLILSTIDPNHIVSKQAIQQCQQHLQQQKEQEEEQKKKIQEKEEEEDLLDDFFSEVETAISVPTSKNEKEFENDDTTNKKEEEDTNGSEKKSSTIQEQVKELGTAESQIDRLVNVPNYEWKNLNPYIVLDISHLSTMEQINQRYKALSLLLHPDKGCNHPKAKQAWEELQKANKLLQDDTKRQHVVSLIEQGLKQGKRDFSTNNQDNRFGSVEKAQEIAIMKIFAKIENSRRDVERRKRKYEQRERDLEDEEKKRLKDEHQFNQSWKNDSRVEKRIGNWRTFHQSKK